MHNPTDKQRPTRSLGIMAALFTALLAGASGGQSISLQLGWGPASWVVIVSLATCAVLAIGAVVLYNVQKSRREVRVQTLDYERLFAEGVARNGLSDPDAARLRALLKFEPSAPPPAIFEAISLFERCIHAEAHRLMAPSIPHDQRKLEAAALASLRQKLGFNVLPFEHPLVSTRNISLGQVGSVFGKSSRNPLIQRAVTVENNLFTFRLQYNVQKEESVNFVRGASVRFVFARQNDGFYGIVLTVVDADSAGSIVLDHTLELKRNQLRQYVRIEVSIPLKVRLIKTVDPSKSDIKQGQAADAKMVDVSGGGMGFICPSALKPGDLVSLSFQLGPAQLTGVAGKILRISLQEGKSQTLFRHHVEFTTIETSRREQIVRYVFDRQRQMNQWR